MNTNTSRRGFLGVMVGGVAVAAAQSFPFRVFSFPTQVIVKDYDFSLATVAGIGQYSDYVNFSDFSLALAMDPAMAECARQLGIAAKLELNTYIRAARMTEMENQQ